MTSDIETLSPHPPAALRMAASCCARSVLTRCALSTRLAVILELAPPNILANSSGRSSSDMTLFVSLKCCSARSTCKFLAGLGRNARKPGSSLLGRVDLLGARFARCREFRTSSVRHLAASFGSKARARRLTRRVPGAVESRSRIHRRHPPRRWRRWDQQERQPSRRRG